MKKLTIPVVVLLAILMMSVASHLGIAADDEPKYSTAAFQPFLWFDCDTLSQDMLLEIRTNGYFELKINEFPGTAFRWIPYTYNTIDKLLAIDADGEKVLNYEWQFPGPIRSIHLADLNSDGLPEFCATARVGFGYISEHVFVYDYAAEKSYELSARSSYNYSLFIQDGELLATKREAVSPFSVVKTGRLAIIDDELVIIGPDQQNHQGTVLYQPSSRPATVTLKNSADKEIASAETDENGAYTILVPTAPAGESYTLVITKPGYLSYIIKNFTINEGEDIEEIDLSQLAGDINGDGVVNSIDLTYLLSEFNCTPQQYPNADFNGDDLVNSVDLTYLLAGFNKRAIIDER